MMQRTNSKCALSLSLPRARGRVGVGEVRTAKVIE